MVPAFMTLSVPSVATVRSLGSILNSVKWTIELVGAKGSRAAVPGVPVLKFGRSTAAPIAPAKASSTTTTKTITIQRLRRKD